MKRIALILAAVLLAFGGFAQKQPKFTEDDAKQFYRTMQGDYVMQVNDSTTAMVHFTPIWEKPDNRFQWMYVEATVGKKVVFQKVLEVQPKTSKKFRVYLHDLRNPEQFVGKWGNRNLPPPRDLGGPGRADKARGAAETHPRRPHTRSLTLLA